ncbi:MAG: RNA methyltransferase [Puniceicoccales bacterium]|jgi:TrmH family RNA methyltransferase|nr:RNA methyltransferase [Puniceicoccales bacterium]
MFEKISSRHNEKIKFIDKLKKSSDRKKFGIFPVEGFREIFRAHSHQFITELFFCEKYFTDREIFFSFIRILEGEHIPLTQITPEVYKKISLRENGDGLVAFANSRSMSLNECVPPQNGLFVVTENIEKPSNFGAIVRTAESAGVDGIIVLNHSTEIFNPNGIRNSQGAVFFANIYDATTEEFLKFSQQYQLSIYVASPQAQKLYFEEDFRMGTALLVGSENKGVSDFWLQQNHTIRIPQNGESDSLNVSIATAIILYECIRQRSEL